MSDSKQFSKAQVRAQERAKKQRQSYIVMALGAILIVAVLIIINQPEEFNPVSRPNVDRNTVGDPNAPVTLIEYSDFQCGYCRNFFLEKEELLLTQYIETGKVYFIYRPFSSHPDSVNAAEAAYCAGDQNKFWEMHDLIFSSSYGLTLNNLISMAKRLDIDMKAFEECLNGHKYTDQVAQDLEEGKAAGVTGTPAFVINGQVVVKGNEDWSVFIQALDAALAEAGN